MPHKGLGESELVTLSVSINQHSRHNGTMSLFHRQHSDSIIKRLQRNLASPTTLAIQARQSTVGDWKQQKCVSLQQPMAGIGTYNILHRYNTRNAMTELAYTNNSKLICMNMYNVIGLITMEQTMRNERVPKFYSSTWQSGVKVGRHQAVRSTG